VVVTPVARGFYVNDVSVRAAALDPNAANDQASATLGVTSLAVNGCVVPRLRHAPAAVAKAVLKHLGCRVQLIAHHSGAVRSGNVIRTRPGPGRYRFGTRIELLVSSGRRP
jgi:beta-lactam-binding protein with PASTA domain